MKKKKKKKKKEEEVDEEGEDDDEKEEEEEEEEEEDDDEEDEEDTEEAIHPTKGAHLERLQPRQVPLRAHAPHARRLPELGTAPRQLQVRARVGLVRQDLADLARVLLDEHLRALVGPSLCVCMLLYSSSS